MQEFKLIVAGGRYFSDTKMLEIASGIRTSL